MTTTAQPLVSIVTPSYNQAQYLEQTILSILNQSYTNIEYIVIDGGSQDGSVEIIKKYETRIACWQSEKDDGFAAAISHGFTRSNGDILAYINSDDLLAPDAVEKAVAALNRHQAAVMIYGNRVCLDEDGELLYVRPNLPILSGSPYVSMIIGQESCFWRRNIYFEVGGISTNLKFAIDYDLFSKFAQKGRIIHVGDVWGFFRKHPTSKTMTQYQTIGKREVSSVQLAVWGKRVNRVKWLLMLFAIRSYALLATPFIRKPLLPNSLPSLRSKSFLRRYVAALHETSWAKRILNKMS